METFQYKNANAIRVLLSMGFVITLMLGFSRYAQAQEIVEFNGNQVVANSLIVQIQNTTFKANGTVTDSRQAADLLLDSFEADVSETLDDGAVQEWRVDQSRMGELIEELNAVPGVMAFPNFVFKREELESTPLDLGGVSSANTKRDGGMRVTISTGEVAQIARRESVSGLPVIYENYFADELAASEFVVYDYAGNGTQWEFVGDSLDGRFEAVNRTDSLNSMVATDLFSPYLDMSTLDPAKGYRLRFFLENGFISSFQNVYVNFLDGNYEPVGASYEDSDGLIWVDVSEFVGDTVSFSFYVEASNVQPGDFLAAIDDVVIEEYPTNDEFLALQYALHNDGSFIYGYSVPGADVSVFDAWKVTTGDSSVVVVVYDDGVDFDHPDLAGNAWVNPGEDLNGDGVITGDEYNDIDDDGNGYPDDFWGWSPIFDDNSYLNAGSFHGTHVAGIIGAEGGNGIGVSGVAQDVSLVSVMIFDENGYTNSLAIIKGYNYINNLLDSGVPVVAVNQSWGGGELFGYDSAERFVQVMTNYARYHADYGALWVVSAGNDAMSRDDLPFYSIPNNIQSPNVITVASSDDADRLSYFSDFGTISVDVTAPGSDIASTYPIQMGFAYAYLSGTSMAAPMVTGAIALAKAAHPDESGFDLMSRVLSGGDVLSELQGVVGEGERLNAHNMVDAKNSLITGIVKSHSGAAPLQRTYLEDQAYTTVGFLNYSGSDLTVSEATIADDGGGHFQVMDFTDGDVLVPAGGALGIPVSYNNFGQYAEHSATLNIQTSQGPIQIDLAGREQLFPYIYLEPWYEDFGVVQAGSQLTTSFNIMNDGPGTLQFGVEQYLLNRDDDWSEAIGKQATFKPSTPSAGSKASMDKASRQQWIEETVTARLADMQTRARITLPHPGELTEHTGPVELWFDDLEDPALVDSTWLMLALGEGDGEGETFGLSSVYLDTVLTNVLLAGDFTNGYQNNTLAVAVSPVFDFSNLEIDGTRLAPSWIEFDYAASLEPEYDLFYVNVISGGQLVATLDITDFGSLINDGYFYRTYLDLSQFNGLQDVEFWFIMSTDELYVGGWGALFDNIRVMADKEPFYYSLTQGSVEPFGSTTVDLTVNTDVIGDGGYLLVTELPSNAPNSFLEDETTHVLEFENRSTVVRFDTDYQFLGELPPFTSIVSTELGFANESPFGVNFNTYTSLQRQNDEYGFSQKSKQMKAPASGPHTKQHVDRNALIRTMMGHLVSNPMPELDVVSLQKRKGAGEPVAPSSILTEQARMEASLMEYQDFQGGTLPEGWLVDDYSYSLGSLWSVQDISILLDAQPNDPQYVLNAGDLDKMVILDNTLSQAWTPIYDVPDNGESQSLVIEFDYSFLLEDGYDFVNLFILEWHDGEEGLELGYVEYMGSSGDLLQNDGNFHTAFLDLPWLRGQKFSIVFQIVTDEFVQSNWALIDNLSVSLMDRPAYVTPEYGYVNANERSWVDLILNQDLMKPGYYSVYTTMYYEDVDYLYPTYENYNVTDFIVGPDGGGGSVGTQQFIVSVGQGTSSIDLTLGLSDQATEGEDAGLDLVAPPAPPAGAFDARIRRGDVDYLSDVQPSGNLRTEWEIRVSMVPGGSDVVLEWNPDIPLPGSVTLLDAVNGSFVNVNMRAASSATIPSSITTLKVVQSMELSMPMAYEKGWNLVGMPVMANHDTYMDLYANAIDGQLYMFAGSYQSVSAMTPGMGYWLRLSESGVDTLTGAPIMDVNMAVNSGWNLVGGISYPVPVDAISDPDSILATGPVYGFKGAYVAVDTLMPGYGYWVRASAEGVLNMTVSGEAPPKRASSSASPDLTAFDRVRFLSSATVDAASEANTITSLYFGQADGGAPVDAGSFVLPPVPPAGLFDARYADQRSLSIENRVEITLQQTSSPVWVRLEAGGASEVGYLYKVIQWNGPLTLSQSMVQAGETVAIHGNTSTVEIVKESRDAAMPSEYRLEANYPNPFNPSTEIRFALPEAGDVRIEVFDVAGRRVAMLVNAPMNAGFHTVSFDARNLSSGTYFYRMSAGGFVDVRSMMLIK